MFLTDHQIIGPIQGPSKLSIEDQTWRSGREVQN
jgi:hypothetical protein